MSGSAQPLRSRAERARLHHPLLWQRIRAGCHWASSEVDLDDHAAGIVELVTRAQAQYERLLRR